VPAAASGVWASALVWSPSLLFGIPSGSGRLPASWASPAESPQGDSAPGLARSRQLSGLPVAPGWRGHITTLLLWLPAIGGFVFAVTK
jgi:hypothetical protein